MLPWAFRARFRRAAFGWRGSKLAIERIHEALAEIRTVARQDPATAAEGAVLFLEKLSPALSQTDSSIEHLGDHWGDLCATPELASVWADQLLPTQRNVLRDRQRGTYAFFSGTTLCYSALFKAGRHDELLELLALDPRPIWQYLIWGARVLAARGQVDEAIAYVREHAGSTTSLETDIQCSAASAACTAKPGCLTRWSRAARVNVLESQGEAQASCVARSPMGHGYELTCLDAHEAHQLAIEAARTAQQIDQAQAIIEQVLAADRPMSAWMRRSLGIAPTSPLTLLPSRQH